MLKSHPVKMDSLTANDLRTLLEMPGSSQAMSQVSAIQVLVTTRLAFMPMH